MLKVTINIHRDVRTNMQTPGKKFLVENTNNYTVTLYWRLRAYAMFRYFGPEKTIEIQVGSW